MNEFVGYNLEPFNVQYSCSNGPRMCMHAPVHHHQFVPLPRSQYAVQRFIVVHTLSFDAFSFILANLFNTPFPGVSCVFVSCVVFLPFVRITFSKIYAFKSILLLLCLTLHFISFRCVPAKRRSKEHAYNLQHTHEAQGAVLKKSWLKENVSKASIKPTILIPTLM